MKDDFEFEWNLYHNNETRSYHDIKLIENLKDSLKEIAKECPILKPQQNTKTHLFEQSTKHRQNLAKLALENSQNNTKK